MLTSTRLSCDNLLTSAKRKALKVNRVMDCWEVIVLIGGTAGPVNTIVRVHVYLDLKKNTAWIGEVIAIISMLKALDLKRYSLNSEHRQNALFFFP